MSSFNIYNLWYKNIPHGWEELNVKKELIYLNRILKKDNGKLLPFPDFVFRAFHEIKPDDIKVVIMDEFPYNGISNQTSIDVGVPFYNQKGNQYQAKKILKLMGKNENEPFTILYKNGFFLIHSSLTGLMGTKKDIEKHSYIWKDFLFKVFLFLNDKNKKIKYLVFGYKIGDDLEFLGRSSSVMYYRNLNDENLKEYLESEEIRLLL